METQTDKWQELLNLALTSPGKVSEAYAAFHNYSLGNQLLALSQCCERGIQTGPIATYQGWRGKGRNVRKGEKAIALYMPVAGRKRESDEDGEDDEVVYTRFILRHNWFVVSQTEGQDYSAQPIPEWNRERALSALSVTAIPFDLMHGNVQGFARAGRKLAISPVADHPARTLFHELGHILLGHCEEGLLNDSAETPRSLQEVEAESVAMLCSAALGMDGIEYSRGYVQSWANGISSIPPSSCRKIFKAADEILKAGRPPVVTPEEELAALKAKLAEMESKA